MRKNTETLITIYEDEKGTKNMNFNEKQNGDCIIQILISLAWLVPSAQKKQKLYLTYIKLKSAQKNMIFKLKTKWGV